MPRVGITVYDLLLSCPGDVLDLKDTIDSCVKSFNASIGEANNIRIELKHWSTDGFSQSGDKPQNILNKQFIDECDLCVALLGIRFGTPTDNYDSGTEEEIEKMLAQGKQVFLYFVERNVDPSNIDVDQFKKVQEFKEKYAEKGLYTVVKSAEELRTEFQNALSLYFIKLVAPHISQQQMMISPSLKITTINEEKETVVPFHTNYQNSRQAKEKEANILSLIDKISSIEVVPSLHECCIEVEPELTDEDLEDMSYADVEKALKHKKISQTQFYKLMGTKPPVYSNVVIEDSELSLITNFCSQHSIKLSEKFYYLGNLQRETSFPFVTIWSNTNIKYLGSESEQNKYNLMRELLMKIREYNHMIEYFNVFDSMYCLSFVTTNEGNTFDEDIDVKLFVKKGYMTDIDKTPKPGLFFLDEAVELNVPELFFTGHHHPHIDDYSNYPTSTYIPSEFVLPFKSRDEEIKELQDEYQEMLEYVFCYEIKETDDEDILCFNIPYLKQNTKMFFPSYLFFTNMPENIRYEIRSKHSPEVYKGVLTINK